MTSIIHPVNNAIQLATKAQESLRTASAILNAPRPMNSSTHGEQPIGVPEFPIGIPEHNGPDSPDNPWFINQPDRERGVYNVAAGHAREAIVAIDSAVDYGRSFLAADVVNAFSQAKEQAQSGVTQLTSPATGLADPSRAVLQFDGADLWLGLAKNLIALRDRPAVVPEPRPTPPIVTPTPMPRPTPSIGIPTPVHPGW